MVRLPATVQAAWLPSLAVRFVLLIAVVGMGLCAGGHARIGKRCVACRCAFPSVHAGGLWRQLACCVWVGGMARVCHSCLIPNLFEVPCLLCIYPAC